MLKVRVIPTLLLKNYGLVKGKSFDSWRRVGTVLPAVNVYNSRNVDELILVDIEASIKDKEFSIDSVNDIADNCFVPLSSGGGINNISSAKSLIENGCDKVTLNSSIYTNPQLITELANLFGSQAVVASIDVFFQKDKYTCFSHSGSKDEMVLPVESKIALKLLSDAGYKVKLETLSVGHKIPLQAKSLIENFINKVNLKR